MDWNSFFHSKYMRGGLCALLIAAILLGLWLPGMGLKEVQPENPLEEESVREITVLKLGETVQKLNTTEEPGGEQGRKPEAAKPDTSAQDGDDGQESGNQGTDGGEILPSDLSLVLTWEPKNGGAKRVACAPEKTQPFSVNSYELTGGMFHYSVNLTGKLEKDAEIVDERCTTASGQEPDKLADDVLLLKAAPGSDRETYNLTFTVRMPERDVTFRFEIAYRELPDVQLSFKWTGSRGNGNTLVCAPNGSVSGRIKDNQLTAGAISYAMELTGADGSDARFLPISCVADGFRDDNLKNPDSLIMSMPEGASSNTYRITVPVLVKGNRITFEVVLHYGYDVSLLMDYTIYEDGQPQPKSILCQNGKVNNDDKNTVYDNQLENGILEYEMAIVGDDSGGVEIKSVSCSQSGGVIRNGLEKKDKIQLRMNGKTTGQNTFTVEAEDHSGTKYTFDINIPYKPWGSNTIDITLNLHDGDEVTNETPIGLTVTAYSTDANGAPISIPAKGTNNEYIRVELDGVEVDVESSSGGDTWEYTLIPSNPEIGDRNEHTLYVYAEDAYGNYGEETLTLIGLRREAGQKIGEATVLVDMTVLGLGIVGYIKDYDVLADEPVSYVVAKAVMGVDTGEPFGAAKESLGFSGNDLDLKNLDNGFYLRSLNIGLPANALEEGSWPGTTEEEVLNAIDDRFGKGTGLATLWRCLYRNGLNKSTGSGGRFGEFDYTSGSGWMYSVGGSTYYPGQSMSSVYLRSGDMLTLRYTLAYGWDVGGGSAGYGNTVGYCVTAVNGSFHISHRWETVEDPDGAVHRVCHCCGLVEDCAHEHTIYKDLEDGTHIRFCEDCKTAIGDPMNHNWTYTAEDAEDSHVCPDCGAAERHLWKEVEGTNTATCTEPGVRKVRCDVCGMEKEEEVPAKGHTLDNRWNNTAAEHWQKCSTCGEEVSRAPHEYAYNADWDDFECRICNVLHAEECSGTPTIQEATCQKIVYHCDGCGCDLTKYGSFDEYHAYENGVCRYCGGEDPNYEPHEHDYQQTERVEPTCTEDGYIEYACDCGDSYRETLPATGHSWGEWTTAEDGEEVRYCQSCGAKEQAAYDTQMLFISRLFQRLRQKQGEAK